LFDLLQKIKELLNILEIFSGWDGRLVVWGGVGAVMSDFEIGELHDI
jgi:hypothetical protein